MNVHPAILDHPKFLAFAKELGVPNALDYLVRLWGHCQTQRRGEKWGKITVEFVEAVCRWDGQSGALYRALVAKRFDRDGWAKETKAGFVVCGWEEHNSSLCRSWSNGRKSPGRPRSNPTTQDNKPTGNPRVSDNKPTGNPRKTQACVSETLRDVTGCDVMGTSTPPSRAREDDESKLDSLPGEYEWPTRAEWWAAAQVEGLPETEIQAEWDNQERKVPESRWRGISRSRLRHHASFVRGKMQTRGGVSKGSNGAAGGAASRIGMEGELKRLEAEIDEHVAVVGANPTAEEKADLRRKRDRRDKLRAELGELATR